jgi:hypothetical protein
MAFSLQDFAEELQALREEEFVPAAEKQAAFLAAYSVVQAVPALAADYCPYIPA